MEMVLEAIVSPSAIRKNPWIMLVYSIVLSTTGIWVAYYTFPDSSSILSLAFITVGMVPLMRHLFLEEEAEEVNKPGSAGSFLYRHFHLLEIYTFFFLGLVISFSFWYTVLPVSGGEPCLTGQPQLLGCDFPSKEQVFQEQEKVWNSLVLAGTGQATLGNGPSSPDPAAACLGGNKEFWACTGFILSHNAGVLLFAVIFSILYGAGSVFLLSWNASVIALFIGKEILSNSVGEGLVRALGYLPHGMFEITGYFAGAIAGGIISVLITKQQHRTKEVGIILRDVSMVFLAAMVLLVIGAMVEAACLVSGLCL